MACGVRRGSLAADLFEQAGNGAGRPLRGCSAV